ncbi:MAG TPA: glycosyltransferase, partial [Bacteroidota bacterium]|nr:glycosyltransferase [Bacteroidota bacterium]
RTQAPYFLENGVSEDCIHVIPHGIDADFFQPPAARQTGPFRVISVGSYRRDFGQLAQIFTALGRRSDIVATVVAPAEVRALFEGVPGVTFQSGLTDQELLDVYQGASCLLMTASNSTANNALLEAMACGVPVVSSSVGGLPELNIHNQTGYIAEIGDIDRMAKYAVDLLANPAKHRAFSEAARNRAIEFNLDKVVTQYEEYYQRVLNEEHVPAK